MHLRLLGASALAAALSTLGCVSAVTQSQLESEVDGADEGDRRPDPSVDMEPTSGPPGTTSPADAGPGRPPTARPTRPMPTPPPVPVPECDPSVCSDVSLAVVTLPHCCTEQDTCGADMSAVSDFIPMRGCAEQDAPGTEDLLCSFQLDAHPLDAAPGNELFDIEVPALGSNLSAPGCCRPDGMCGVMMDLIDLGPDLGTFQIGLGCMAMEHFDLDEPADFPCGGIPVPGCSPPLPCRE